jgi:SAM-dependent methyltransferase
MNIPNITIDDHTVSRYRRNYGLGPEIGADHVERHLKLEFELTQQLLASSRSSRWKIFYDCYTTLYKELPWLNKTDGEADGVVGPDTLLWASLLGSKATIFEVGSGQARLLKYLTSIGHSCVATEITPERGSKHLNRGDGLIWRNTDGIHLAQFEKTQNYDFVISSQVVEHLHPDDLVDHFNNARMILKPGGEYIFDTPHRGAGPHDLSLVFELDRAIFMHLREYTFLELRAALRVAGFREIRAIFVTSGFQPRRSALYLEYCILWDRMLTALRLHPRTERRMRWSWRVRNKLRLPPNIWLSARA